MASTMKEFLEKALDERQPSLNTGYKKVVYKGVEFYEIMEEKDLKKTLEQAYKLWYNEGFKKGFEECK